VSLFVVSQPSLQSATMLDENARYIDMIAELVM